MKRFGKKITEASFLILGIVCTLVICSSVMYYKSSSLIVSQDKGNSGNIGKYVLFPTISRYRRL